MFRCRYRGFLRILRFCWEVLNLDSYWMEVIDLLVHSFSKDCDNFHFGESKNWKLTIFFNRDDLKPRRPKSIECAVKLVTRAEKIAVGSHLAANCKLHSTRYISQCSQEDLQQYVFETGSQLQLFDLSAVSWKYRGPKPFRLPRELLILQETCTMEWSID